MNSIETFGQRKKDHIKISLLDSSQAVVDQFSQVELQHNPLPEINFNEISLHTKIFDHPVQSPLFVSSMTLGHDESQVINQRIASACADKGWMMGVGSQRRQLFDSEAGKECQALRQQFPELVLFGNIGLAQVIEASVSQVEALVKSLGAQFMVVHTNPLQEAIQKEGTPSFAGGKKALLELCGSLSVPVVLKETGCGFSASSLKTVRDLPLGALDISGLGGTHWGRIEGLRENPNSLAFQVAETFAFWGVSTVDSLLATQKENLPFPVWASGGIRSGLDAAKAMALGAEMVGLAMPILRGAMAGDDPLRNLMNRFDQELKTALFCLGCKNVSDIVGNEALWTKR